MKPRWRHIFSYVSKRPAAPIRRCSYFRPRLERLESRLAPAGHDSLGTAIPVHFDTNEQAQMGGLLSDPNQADFYVLSLHAGDEINADLAAPTGGSLQGALRVFDNLGKQFAFQESQAGTSATTLTFDALKTGSYFIGVSSNGNYDYNPLVANSSRGGLTSGLYTLTLAVTSIVTPEITSNGFPANASFASGQQLVGDTLGNAVVQGTYTGGMTQYYLLKSPAAEGITVSITSADGAVLPELALYSASEQLLIQSDAPGPGNPSAALTQQLQTGEYYLAVSTWKDTSSGNQEYSLVASVTPAPTPVQTLIASPVATGDFNHDGNLDVVAFGYDQTGATTLSVLSGRADGTFSTAFTAPIPGSQNSTVEVGDFNHDGNLDIVCADQIFLGNTTTDGINYDQIAITVTVFLGRGDGTFLPPVSFNVANVPSLVNFSSASSLTSAVGDFNHDGDLDLVLANQAIGVSVLFGKGDGTFGPAVSYPVGGGRSSGYFSPGGTNLAMVAGDFNNDGNLDIAAAAYDADFGVSGATTISVLLGNGNGSFVLQPAFSDPTLVLNPSPFAPANTLATGDLNHDGNLDLVVPNHDGFLVFLGHGNGTFGPGASYDVKENALIGVSPATNLPAVVDINNDGNLDIVSCDTAGNVAVLLGNGDGTFAPARYENVGVPVSTNAMGDFNHDGNLDFATGYTVPAVLGRGDGTFIAPPTNGLGDEPFAIATGDFNHDGILDVVTSNLNSMSVLLGRGDGTFSPAVSYPGGDAGVAVGDFNHDGNLDIVSGSGPSVMFGRGDGSFLPAVPIDPSGTPEIDTGQQLAVGDFNNDGDLDVVTEGFTGMAVYLGRGDGTFLPPTYPPNSTDFTGGNNGYQGLALGHLNGDGHLDIVSVNESTVSVLFGRGDGTFLPAVSYPLPTISNAINAYSVVLGDFNGDGRLDMAIIRMAQNQVVLNFGEGYIFNFASTLTVLLNRGDGSFLPAVSYPLGISNGFYQSVAVGDFNGDGHLDIVTTTPSVLLLGRGDGTFLPAIPYATGSFSFIVAPGDFNNDGNLDLATVGVSDDAVVLLGQGNNQFQTATAANGIVSRSTPYLEDLSGDGIPDEIVLSSNGDILFRQGLGAPEKFGAPQIINPGDPARDVTLFRTTDGWAVAAVDDAGDTVSIYTWDKAERSFEHTVGFDTGNLPVRIGAADLTGDGMDDLVVANDFDDSVTIALQQLTGRFVTLTQAAGLAPSDIAFLSEPGQIGPDIVVSDQASGDFSVLCNDATVTSLPTFSRVYRFRSGSDLYNMNVDPDTGDQTIESQLQTVGLVTGDFTGSDEDDVITLNRDARSFTLVPNLGQGIFVAPQYGKTFLTAGADPSQIVPLWLPGDALPSVAILMPALGQIWIYRNNGNGVFAAPTKIDAGNDPSGFSVARVDGNLALLVGNAYGDILTLLYNGQGGFGPANLQNVALAVGTIAATGQQFAVVADQGLDQVSLYYRIPGTDQFGSPVAIEGDSQFPLLAPGDVQTFHVSGDPDPYLAVANSLSNNVLVYQDDPTAGKLNFVTSCQVGDDPFSITVADINGDGIPDLLVANQGSNDISVLIGSVNATTKLWTETPYQRLSSGGSGPIAVAVQNANDPSGPNLIVTNSDGKVVLLPGIGLNGQGSGFFQDTNPQSFNLGNTIVQSLLDPATDQLLVVGANGAVSTLTATGFALLIDNGVATLDAEGSFLIAGRNNGSVALLSANGSTMASEPTGFLDAFSALQALQSGNQVDVFATQQGDAVPIIVSFLLPVVEELPTPAPVAQPTVLPGAELLLVATLVTGGFVENLPNGGSFVDNSSGGAVPVIPSQGTSNPQIAGSYLTQLRNQGGGADAETIELPWTEVPTPEGSKWMIFPLGVDDALRDYLNRQQADDTDDVMGDVVPELLPEFGETMPPPMASPCPAQGELPPDSF